MTQNENHLLTPNAKIYLERALKGHKPYIKLRIMTSQPHVFRAFCMSPYSNHDAHCCACG